MHFFLPCSQVCIKSQALSLTTFSPSAFLPRACPASPLPAVLGFGGTCFEVPRAGVREVGRIRFGPQLSETRLPPPPSPPPVLCLPARQQGPKGRQPFCSLCDDTSRRVQVNQKEPGDYYDQTPGDWTRLGGAGLSRRGRKLQIATRSPQMLIRRF